MFNILYDGCLLILFMASLPKLLFQGIVQGRYRGNTWQRFGVGFPKIEKKGKKLVWVHAISMGETKSVAALARKFKDENTLLLVSSVTETGHAEAQRSIPEADYHVYMPLDFSWVIKPLLKEAKPDLVILCETDYWYNFLSTADAIGAKVALVSGKLSPRSLRRYRALPALSQKLFAPFDLFCVQSPRHLERFKELGIPENKLQVTGNLKINGATTSPTAEWRDLLGIKSDAKVLVIGSTHDPEEKLLLNTLQRVWRRFPELHVILVPRHPERFDEVAALLRDEGVPFSRYSKGESGEQLLLLDAMGLLGKAYAIADIAIVAGSYTVRVGGHNVIEPSAYGVPVIYGPHVQTQLDLVALMEEYGAGEQVPADKLEETLCAWLGNEGKRKEIGSRGLKLVSEASGATEKTWQALGKIR